MGKFKHEIKAFVAQAATTGMVRRAYSGYCDGFATVFRLGRPTGVHDGIAGCDPGLLERVLVNLKKRQFNLVSILEVVNAAQGKGDLPGHSVAFTLDHGYRDQLEILAPLFSKHEIPLTVFLTTGFLNGELWPWDAKIDWLLQQSKKSSLALQIDNDWKNWSFDTRQERLRCAEALKSLYTLLPCQEAEQLLSMLEVALEIQLPAAPPSGFSPASWEQVRQLENGGIRFAPHTHSSRVLSRLTEDQMRFELIHSLELIRAKTDAGLPVLAYPVGMARHFGFREMQIAEKLGFSGAFAACNDHSGWREGKGFSPLRYSLGRFDIPDSVPETLWLAAGMDNILKKFYQKISQVRPILQFKQRNADSLVALEGPNDLIHINSEQIRRLVFVCRGNVCRSPYAEAVAKACGFSAISCGTDVKFSVPAETMGICAALMRGKNISGHMSRSIFDIEINKTDCLVAMDHSHLPVSRDIALREGCQVTLLGLWRQPRIREIEDPYGGGLEIFRHCFCKIDEAMEGLSARLTRDGSNSGNMVYKRVS